MINIINLVYNRSEYATLPASVADLKLLLQLEGTAYDAQLEAYLWASTEQVEQYTQISLTEKYAACTFEQRSKSGVRLPMGPISSITLVRWKYCNVRYEDAEYTILNQGELDELFVGQNTRGNLPWPTYRVEYVTAPATNYSLIEAVKQQAVWMYNRRDEANGGKMSDLVKGLLNAYKYGAY